MLREKLPAAPTAVLFLAIALAVLAGCDGEMVPNPDPPVTVMQTTRGIPAGERIDPEDDLILAETSTDLARSESLVIYSSARAVQTLLAGKVAARDLTKGEYLREADLIDADAYQAATAPARGPGS